MTTPTPLTTAQIQQYINQINSTPASQRVEQVQATYDALNAKGYDYAGWAAGVARGDSITGLSALNFLQGTALMGMGGDACRSLTQVQIDKIRVDMAEGYLRKLEAIADLNGGVVNTDVSYKQAMEFHDDAFQKNDLTLDNWTLKTPMDLIQQRYGDQAVEEVWLRLRDTGGTGLDALLQTLSLTYAVGQFSHSPDASLSAMAQAWITNTIGALTWEQIKGFWNAALGEFNGINDIDYDINGNVNGFFTSARNWVPRRDPLVLDLNGGGITTSGINPAAPLYFDHAGDGLPNATGWVGAGEGLVVRDLNGNGLIDSGRELFGDNTVLTTGPNAGKNATDGFAALRDLDSNADGKFDASDAVFSSVKIWTDANGDAISQTAELHSFADLGLQSISLTASATSINLVDSNGAATGNTQTFAGSFTRVGGGVGAAATADLVGNLLLSSNNFYRQFNDDPALTPACVRACRASVPTGLRARGRGACGARLHLHQQRGLGSVSVAAANWRRPTGTATRHAGGGGWCAGEDSQVKNFHCMRLAGGEWLRRLVHIGNGPPRPMRLTRARDRVLSSAQSRSGQ